MEWSSREVDDTLPSRDGYQMHFLSQSSGNAGYCGCFSLVVMEKNSDARTVVWDSISLYPEPGPERAIQVS